VYFCEYSNEHPVSVKTSSCLTSRRSFGFSWRTPLCWVSYARRTQWIYFC